jgi:hypothetical protein
VIADVETLATLPAEELAAGFVEALKTGCWPAGRSGSGCGRRGARPADLDDVVFACARYKCEIVAADERDSGLRNVLNLGHTVGPRDRGGEQLRALPPRRGDRLGLLAALRLSGAAELRVEVEAILTRLDLQTELAGEVGSTRSSTRSAATRSGPAP